LLLVVPFLWIWPHPEVLLLVQTATVASSVVVLFLVVRMVLRKIEWVQGYTWPLADWLAAVLMMQYVWFVGLHNALITEFHEVGLLPLPVSLLLYGMIAKRAGWLWIGVLLTLMVKETTFVIPGWFGLWMVWHYRGRWRRLGWMVSVAAAIYGLTVLFVIIPFFAGGDYYYLSEARESSGRWEALDMKFATVWQSLASYGFLPLLAPDALVPVLANWLSRFQSSYARLDLGLHYNAEVAPTLLFAAAFGLKRILSRAKVRIAPLFFSLFVLSVGVIVLSVLTLQSPIRLAIIPDFYRHTENFGFLERLLAAVPEHGLIMASHHLAGKLADRDVLMLRDNYWNYQPDWIVVDMRDGQEPNNFLGLQDPDRVFATLLGDPDYHIYYQEGHSYIFMRGE
jgi:uncharacterized membrane protein